MAKESILFVVNPFSGTSKKRNMPELIQRHLDHDRYRYDYVLTEYPKHGTKLAKDAVEQSYDIVCVIGGDGSVNEVAQSLVYTETSLAIIPGGSGNGFAEHISIPRNPIKAIQKLNQAERSLIDTGVASDHFFLNVTGIGFDALVAYKTKLNTKRGLLPYVGTALKEAGAFRAMEMEITTHEGETIKGNYVAAVVANAAYYGYGFSISPLSSVQDGMLDIILIKETWKVRYFIEAYRFLNQTLHKSALSECLHTRQVNIKVNGDHHFHVDGEGYELKDSFSASINEQSIWVMY
jgi:YegS/Rv2252/BmrU family lipid kinase